MEAQLKWPHDPYPREITETERPTDTGYRGLGSSRATRVTGVTQRLNAFRSINKPVTPDDIDIKTGELAGVVSPTALGKAKG